VFINGGMALGVGRWGRFGVLWGLGWFLVWVEFFPWVRGGASWIANSEEGWWAWLGVTLFLVSTKMLLSLCSYLLIGGEKAQSPGFFDSFLDIGTHKKYHTNY
jgi:hypothetical protein